MSTQEGKVKTSRRNFFKKAAVVGAGSLAACAPKIVETPAQPTPTEAAATDQENCSKYSFETPPDPIPASEISETVSTEVLVLGAGVSGLTTALAAAEGGAKVIVLEKYNRSLNPGQMHGSINTREALAEGNKTDIPKLVHDLTIASGGRADPRLLKSWAENSGRVMDHIVDIANESKVPFTIVRGAYIFGEGTGMQVVPIYDMLTARAKSLGVEFRYTISARQLIRKDNQGPVTGAIAQLEDGKYIQFNASKAVVLATGDYGNNPEMVKRWTEWAVGDLVNLNTLKTNTGDGQAMALWIGAMIEEEPHCAMLHFNAANSGRLEVWPLQPKMFVNKFGERFSNESLTIDYLAPITMRQPGNTRWGICDSKSEFLYNRWGEIDPKALPESIELKEVLTADTIEGLAAQFGADPATLKATVDRYNTFVKQGNDEDFGSTNLGPSIDTPPFYAMEKKPNRLAHIGGPVVTPNHQVLDTDYKVIPNLFAVGNCSGGFYGEIYPIGNVLGIARGYCLTSGYLTGEYIASL